MINYKQTNPKWNRTKIRGTNLRVGMYGCLICCIASLASYFQPEIGVQGVIDLTGFTPDGKLIWKSGIYPSFEYEKIIKGCDYEAIKSALDDPDRAVILGLNGGKHWVVACGEINKGGQYEIADPLGNTDRSFLGINDIIDYMAFFKRK